MIARSRTARQLLERRDHVRSILAPPMKARPRRFAPCLLLLATAACADNAPVVVAPSPKSAIAPLAPPPAPAPASVSGIDLAGMDRAVVPGDDFFAFANGTWMKKTEIPADRSSWGTGGA